MDLYITAQKYVLIREMRLIKNTFFNASAAAKHALNKRYHLIMAHRSGNSSIKFDLLNFRVFNFHRNDGRQKYSNDKISPILW